MAADRATVRRFLQDQPVWCVIHANLVPLTLVLLIQRIQTPIMTGTTSPQEMSRGGVRRDAADQGHRMSTRLRLYGNPLRRWPPRLAASGRRLGTPAS